MRLYAISVSASFPDGPASSTPPHPSLDQYLDLVDSHSHAQIRGFRLLDDARRCLLGRLLRQHIASRALGLDPANLTFGQTDKGRPFVATPPATGFDFNIAHDGDWVLLACVDGEGEGKRVGVDVMTLRNPWEGETVDTFAHGITDQLTPSERAYVHAPALPDATRLTRALALWTLKEAYVKAIGLGLHFDLTRISFSLVDDLLSEGWMTVAASADEVGLSEWRFGVGRWRGCVVGWAVEGGGSGSEVGSVEEVGLDEIWAGAMSSIP